MRLETRATQWLLRWAPALMQWATPQSGRVLRNSRNPMAPAVGTCTHAIGDASIGACAQKLAQPNGSCGGHLHSCNWRRLNRGVCSETRATQWPLRWAPALMQLATPQSEGGGRACAFHVLMAPAVGLEKKMLGFCRHIDHSF
jgi:hypothetical protein